MPFLEGALATGFVAVATSFTATMSVSAKHATDRIASFLPTATVAAYQLILSSYSLKGQCSVGEAVLLWITLWVLTLVTAGMALLQHRNETDAGTTVYDHLFTGGSLRVYPWARAFFSAVAFFFVSFLTPPAPQCLVPQTPIPSSAAWIVAVLLGSVMTLGALVFPADVKELREARDKEKKDEEDPQQNGPSAKPPAQRQEPSGNDAQESSSKGPSGTAAPLKKPLLDEED